MLTLSRVTKTEAARLVTGRALMAQVGSKDRVDGGAGSPSNVEGLHAGGLQRHGPVRPRTAHDHEAGLKALFERAAVARDHGDKRCGMGSDLAGPGFKPPDAVPIADRLVVGIGGVSKVRRGLGLGGKAPADMEDLDGADGEALTRGL